MNIEERANKLGAYIRCATFPRRVEAVTLPNDDGTFSVFVNDSIPQWRQVAALEHELNHIEQDHFYNDIKGIEVIEAEANLVLVFN